MKRVMEALVSSQGGIVPDWLAMDAVTVARGRKRKHKSLPPIQSQVVEHGFRSEIILPTMWDTEILHFIDQCSSFRARTSSGKVLGK
jgi:hypothetical protein